MKVWVTRDEPVDGPLGTALRAAGLQVVHEPVITRRCVCDAGRELASLRPSDWLVLSSAFALECIDPAAARVPRTAVVGAGTRDAAKLHGLRVRLVSSDGDAQGLFAELFAMVERAAVCYPRSSLATPPDAPIGITLLSPVVYDTAPRDFDRAVIATVDIVAVASASAANAIGPMDRPVASIGRSTTAALRKIGVTPRVQAAEPSFAALAEAIRAYADSRHQRA